MPSQFNYERLAYRPVKFKCTKSKIVEFFLGYLECQVSPASHPHVHTKRSHVKIAQGKESGTKAILTLRCPIETARQRNEVGDREDRQVVLLVRELGRHQVKIAAVQVLKWFRNVVYKIRGSVMWQQTDRFLGLGSLSRGERV